MRAFLVRLLLCAALCLLTATLRAQTGPEISRVRVTTVGETTRVTLEIDRAAPHSLGLSADGSKLLVDIPAGSWRLGSEPIAADGLVTSLRFGRTSDGVARLEADLNDGTRVAGQRTLPADSSDPRWRLVIFLEGNAPTILARRAPPLPSVRPGVPEQADAVGALEAQPVQRPAEALEDVPMVQVGLPAAPRRPKSRLPMIVLDPGHGGSDPGAIAVNGRYEKDIVLELAQTVAAQLERSGRYRVASTRSTDTYVGLRERIAIARELGGDLFISLHADSIGSPERRGASIYTLSETASDDEAARLAATENKADILADEDLSNHHATVAGILLDLARRDTLNKSIAFADLLAEEVARVSPLLRRHRRFAGFAVLKLPDMPSVLLETGYLSNPDDTRNLMRAQFRKKLSTAILEALDRYFDRRDS